MDWIKGILATGAIGAAVWLAPTIVEQLVRRALPFVGRAGVCVSCKLAAVFGKKRGEKFESALQVGLVDLFLALMIALDKDDGRKRDAWLDRLIKKLRV